MASLRVSEDISPLAAQSRTCLVLATALSLMTSTSLLRAGMPDSVLATFRLEYGDTLEPPATFIPHKVVRRPRVGLALSGGGIRGLAQIGVLQVLEENDIPMDFIAGSSIGSIIGGLYAAGYSPNELWEIVRNIDWRTILVDTPPRSSLLFAQKAERSRHLLQIRFRGLKPYIPPAITRGQQLTSTLTDVCMLATHGYVTNFDSLRVPLRIVAADLTSGNKVVLAQGNLVDAMRASVAIPLLFTPVEYRGMILADGGLVDNIPVVEVRSADVDLVIAVDTTSPLRDPRELSLPWQVADQVTSIMQTARNREMLSTADLIISLSDMERSSAEVDDLEGLLLAGREEAKRKLPKIKVLLKTFDNKDSRLVQQYVISRRDFCVGGTTAENLGLDFPKLMVPDNMTSHDIEASLKSIYSSGVLCEVEACIMADSAGCILKYDLQLNPTLNSLKFRGNSCISDSALASLASSKMGQPINYHLAQRDLNSIINEYRQTGYSLARITHVDFNDEAGLLTVHLDEGVIDKIEISGNAKTRQRIIRRELGVSEGSVFNLFEVRQGISNIYATGLFETVSFNIGESALGNHRLIVRVKEKPYRMVRLGARYDSERGERGFLEIVEQNLWGTGSSITSHLQYGDRDQKYALQLRGGRFLQSYANLSFDIYHVQKERFTYVGHRRIGEYRQASSGALMAVGHQIRRLGNVSLEGRIERIDITPLSGRVFQTGRQNIRTLRLRSVVDSQDQLPFATSGKLHTFFYEYSSARVLTSQVSYFKVFSSLESWYTTSKLHTFHPSILWGSCDQTTPYSEQFRLGGYNSLWGLELEELVGRHLIVGAIEYRFLVPWKLPTSVYLSARYGVGALWRSALDVKLKDFLHSIGLSLSVRSLLGPISLTFGRLSDGRSRLYFSAGYEF